MRKFANSIDVSITNLDGLINEMKTIGELYILNAIMSFDNKEGAKRVAKMIEGILKEMEMI